LCAQSWQIVRVSNNDVYHSLIAVLDTIYERCRSRA
jgi:very-short-patch-repair endonuclease